MKYLSAGEWLKAEYGEKVYRLSLQSGCTCPNRDGTLGTDGCSFCSNGGSGEFAAPFLQVPEQIRIAKERVAKKLRHPEAPHKYIAYFQSFTNTYGDPERLRALYLETIRQPEIVGISIGTRPDCIDERMMEILSELQCECPVWIELGLQTIHERTAKRIRRGYRLDAFEGCYRRLKERHISVIVHLILGLPGETERDMLDSVRYLRDLDPVPDGVKLQMLQILKGTALGEEYLMHPFPVMSLEEYGKLLVKCLRLLPKETVVHRITGDGPKKLLIAPRWSADKKHVWNTLQRMIMDAEDVK